MSTIEPVIEIAIAFIGGGVIFAGVAVALYNLGIRKGMEMSQMAWRMAHDEQPIPDDEQQADPNFPTEA